MRLLFISLLILNLFFGAWNLEKRLSGGSLQHSIWFVICLATAVICFLELRHRKSSSSLGLLTLGSLERFLGKVPPEEGSSAVTAGEKKEPHGRSEPEGEELRQVA